MEITVIPNHAGLTDMPSGTNTDHDGRYYTETEVDALTDGTATIVGGWMYFGASDTNGSWRIGPSGNDFHIERRVAGVWVTATAIKGA